MVGTIEAVGSNLTDEARLAEVERKIDFLIDLTTKVLKMSNETRALVGPFGVPMPDGSVLVQTLWGHKVLVDANDMIMAPQLIVYRQWEADLSKLMYDYITSDSVFIDVGANIGYFTCLLAGKIGGSGTGRVVAIEPNPRCLTLLRKNLSINWPIQMDRVRVEAVAVSDKEGIAHLTVPTSGAANAQISSKGASNETVPVVMKPLDAILADVPAADLMKIDVEGFEQFALLGAREFISRSKDLIIVMEWSLGQMAECQSSPSDMIALIEALGLTVFHLPESLNKDHHGFVPYNLEDLERRGYDNIILAHAK
ncbi:MAG: FkbM family methyltransferase [Methylobacterium organophilum]|nr:FkbM family methyltransferase [Methylobacterium organophilum]